MSSTANCIETENAVCEERTSEEEASDAQKPKKKTRRGRKNKNKLFSLEKLQQDAHESNVDCVIEAIRKVAVSGCEMLDVVLGTETNVALPNIEKEDPGAAGLEKYFAEEIEQIENQSKSGESPAKPKRRPKAKKSASGTIVEGSAIIEIQPAEEALEFEKQKKRKPRSRKKKEVIGTVEEKEQQEVNKKKKTAEGKENQLGESPSKSPRKGKGAKSRSPRKSSGMDNEKFPDYWQEEVVKSALKEGTLIKGTLRINKKNFKEGYIKNPEGGLDIFLDGVKARNRSLEGDEVAVKILPEENWKNLGERGVQKSGEVIFILLKMHHRKTVGCLKPLQHKNSPFALLVPRDYRMPRIRIPVSQCPPNFDKNPDMVYQAEISLWQNTTYAFGNLLKLIGMPGTIEVETQSILLDNGLDVTPYDPSFNQYFPSQPYKIPEEEFKYREDFRKQCIFTIDPATARDLDDAVSFRKLEGEEGFEIGVHISDVAHFLTENTPLDEEVGQRATTTYLVQSVFHMLPVELCRLCSLTPGEDKLAFSVLWKVKPDCSIGEPRFTRSVIHSCCQMSYEHAQAIIEAPDDKVWTEEEMPKVHPPHSVKDVVNVVKGLRPIALKLRAGRFENGALRIDQPKVSFRVDAETGLPSEFNIYQNMECHRLIEELMLLANMAVANHLFNHFPDIAMLRSHPPPHDKLMEELSNSLKPAGIDLDVSSSAAIHACLEKFLAQEDVETKAIGYGLSALLAKPMARAKYLCSQDTQAEDQWHYALSVPLYTHFTSPIRRYADVVVHRLLAASLQYTPHPGWDPDHVAQMASVCNGKKWSAKTAGEKSIELFLALYLGMHGAMVEEAVVLSVMDYSLDVLVLRTGSTHRVYTNKFDAKEAKIEHNVKERTVKINWLQPSQVVQTVKTFSVVRVELSKASDLKIVSKLASPVSADEQ
ncbi:DIS3-like exonuclease 2 isoform X2 [Neocloeon triangulifer]|uniref:DIS3-like exonuclease 2 isoform X2 n=1 Tax=Neocloeon triangulifer TaxID=2078957 RepID=UPI00286F3992|nr:DIS3-like exonuclease 2 isoform X2 [Neocloeon triangulifer]